MAKSTKGQGKHHIEGIIDLLYKNVPMRPITFQSVVDSLHYLEEHYIPKREITKFNKEIEKAQAEAAKSE